MSKELNAFEDVLFRLPHTDGNLQLAKKYPERFSLNDGKPVIPEKRSEYGFKIGQAVDQVKIFFDNKPSFYRGLGQLLTDPNSENEEKPLLDRIGLNVDSSRGAVYKPQFLKDLNLKLALLGYNSATLYTEYFEVTGFPHLKQDQLSNKEIEGMTSYAKEQFGIEWYPSIETFGHMEKIFRHKEHEDMRLTYSTLDISHPKAYQLVEALIENGIAPYKTRLINVGCDETSGFDKASYISHIKKEAEILKRMGITGIIWADMIEKFDEKDLKELPEGLILNYWNYDPLDKEKHLERIKSLKKTGHQVLVSPGTHSWNRLYPDLQNAMGNIGETLSAAKSGGADGATLTTWGDDCNESALAPSMPAIIYFSEHCWNDKPKMETVSRKTKAIMKDDFDSFLAPSFIDLPKFDERIKPGNISKILLYEDPLQRNITKYFPHIKFGAYYEGLYKDLKEKEKNSDVDNKNLFSFTLALCDFLRTKADLGNEAFEAGSSKDIRKLREVSEKIADAITKCGALRKIHFELWKEERNEEGFSKLDKRYLYLEERLMKLERDLFNGNLKEDEKRQSHIPA